jgi:apolipoprotein N-acyltransferase
MSIAFHVNSAIQMDYLSEDIFSVLKAVPLGIINSLSRPWPLEIKNALFVPAMLENLILLVLLVVAVLQKVKNPVRSVNFIAFCFLFTFFLYSIIGISTPILGALVRYKIPAMPFLVIAILSLLNTTNFHFYQSQKIRAWIHTYL